MKKIILALLLAYCLSSCHSKLINERICTELFTDSARAEYNQANAVALRSSLWPHSIDMPLNILVKFMNGSNFQRNEVIKYAAFWDSASLLGWNGKHKIRFIFMSDNSPMPSDIRIIFRPGGSSSYVGSDARRIAPSQPTTFFGWVDEQHSEIEIQEVILHELGHALGLVHEHQSPEANIHWDRPKVYQYYHDTQDPPWDANMVDENIFKLYSADQTNYTKFDSLSIMLYSIPASLTTDGYSTPWNTVLSGTDKEFIKTIYPYMPCIPGETCCFNSRGQRIPCP